MLNDWPTSALRRYGLRAQPHRRIQFPSISIVKTVVRREGIVWLGTSTDVAMPAPPVVSSAAITDEFFQCNGRAAMKSRQRIQLAAASGILLSAVLSVRPASALDADAAQTLARQSGCFKCHAIDKKKDGPAYRDVAAKYKGNAEAEAKLIQHVTSGERVKFPDGHEEDHKIVKSKDAAEIKNLVDWILSLEGGTKPQ